MKAPVLKTGRDESPSWVRIPPPPPKKRTGTRFLWMRTRSIADHAYPGPRTGADRDEGLGMLVALVGRLAFLIGVAISRSVDTEAGVPSSMRIVSAR